MHKKVKLNDLAPDVKNMQARAKRIQDQQIRALKRSETYIQSRYNFNPHVSRYAFIHHCRQLHALTFTEIYILVVLLDSNDWLPISALKTVYPAIYEQAISTCLNKLHDKKLVLREGKTRSYLYKIAPSFQDVFNSYISNFEKNHIENQ